MRLPKTAWTNEKNGTFIVKWKQDGSSAEIHPSTNGDTLPPQIKAMIATSLLRWLAEEDKKQLHVDVHVH